MSAVAGWLRRLGQVRAFVALLVLMLVFCGCVFAACFQQVNDIRGDFCSYAMVHRAATLMLPQVQARRLSETSDSQLIRKLGCN